MIIPISNGEGGDEQCSLLDSLSIYFDSSDIQGKELVNDFFKNILAYFPMRTKIELVNLVQTTHQITKIKTKSRAKFNYKILCVELLHTLCKSVLKKESPILIPTTSLSGKKGSFLTLRIPDFTNNDQLSNTKSFINKFEHWCRTPYSLYSMPQSTSSRLAPIREIYTLNETDPKSYILYFFRRDRNLINRVDYNGAHPPTASELEFIGEFQETLNSLV